MNAVIVGLGMMLGMVLGVVIGWLIADRRGRVGHSELQTTLALAQQQAAERQAELTTLQSTRAAESAQLRQLESRAVAAETELRGAQQTAADFRESLNALSAEAAGLRAELADSQNQETAAREALRASHDNIAEQKKLLDEANKKLSESFAKISGDALKQAGESFFTLAKARFDTLSAQAGGALDQRKEQIATLLEPIKQLLKTYQERVDKIEDARVDAYGKLLEQIGGMSETQRALSAQTRQLETALKKSNVRGRWGEIALRRLVEMAGMTERVDYLEQESVRTDDGFLRPDMVVKLPGTRQVVIDSKAIMGAFLDAAAATDDASRSSCLAAHARNVRTRIDDLASKAYWNQFSPAPEFIILFLPGESFLYAACDHDAGLIEYALSRRVHLVTPTTLTALLIAVERGWRQEAISRNAEEIRKLGVDIYDRLAVLAEYLTKLGISLDASVENFNKVVGTVEGRVLVSARKIGELGARNEKQIGEVQVVDKRTREFAEALHPEKSPLLPEQIEATDLFGRS
jgi:DNA recombination protein RmuC